MAVPLTVNGVTFQYPEKTDEDWGQVATAWAQAVTNLISFLNSATLPLATTGVIRLGTNDAICWRNTADTLDACLFIDNLDRLIYDDGVTQKDLGLTGANGNVQHLFPSLDNEIPRFDSTIGTVIQQSGVFIDDSQVMFGVSEYQGATVQLTGDATVNDVVLTNGVDNAEVSKALPPLGTIIAHYDFAGALVPDPDHWHICDGSIQVIAGVSRTLPDLSGRYLVGFGTDGGADIESAGWNVAPVGNTNHEVDISHSHTVNSHNHGISNDGNHSHTVNSHNHSIGSHNHGMPNQSGVVYSTGTGTQPDGPFSNSDPTDNPPGTGTLFIFDQGVGWRGGTLDFTLGAGGVNHDGSHVHELIGNTDSTNLGNTGNSSPGTSSNGSHDHGGSTGNASPGTDVQGSATQSIQPSSIRVRYYMRIQ